MKKFLLFIVLSVAAGAGPITVYWVPSVDDLRALNVNLSEDVIITPDLTWTGGVDGGTWVYRSGSTETDNGTNVVAPNSGSGRWHLMTYGRHNAVTLAGSLDYLSLTNQVLTLGPIDYTTDIVNLPSLAAHDAVTLAGETYLTLTNQQITAAAVNLATQVTGTLAESAIDAAMARDSELHDAVTLAGSYDYLSLTGQVLTLGQIDYDTDVVNKPSLAAHDAVTLAGETYLSLSGQEITAAKIDYTTQLTNTPSAFTPSTHSHPAGEVTPGTFGGSTAYTFPHNLNVTGALLSLGNSATNAVLYMVESGGDTSYLQAKDQIFDINAAANMRFSADTYSFGWTTNVANLTPSLVTFYPPARFEDTLTVSETVYIEAPGGEASFIQAGNTVLDINAPASIRLSPDDGGIAFGYSTNMALANESAWTFYVPVNLDGNTITNATWTGSVIDETYIDAAIARDTELHDAVTLSGAYDYLTLTNQQITLGLIDYDTDVTNKPTIAEHDLVTLSGETYLTLTNQAITAAKINLGNQITGVLNLAGTNVSGLLPETKIASDIARDTELHPQATASESVDYVSLDVGSQLFTFGQVNLAADVQGILPDGNIASTIARDTELHPAVSASGTAAQGYVSFSPITQAFSFYDVNLAVDVTGILAEAYIDPLIARDSELHDAVTLSGETYLSLSGQEITAGAINLAGTQVTGVLPETKIDAAIARDTELHDAVTVSGVYDYLTLSGQDLVRGQVDYNTDITNLPTLNVHDTVTLSGAYDYLTLTNQAITLGQIDYNTDILNLPSLAAHDAVTLSGETYLSLSGQEITAGKLDLSTSVTNTLAASNIDAAIARDTELHPALTTNGTGAHNYVTYTPATQYMEFFDVDLSADVTGVLPDINIDAAIARDTELHPQATVSESVDYVSMDVGSQLFTFGQVNLVGDVQGILPDANIPSTIARDTELHPAISTTGTAAEGYVTFTPATQVFDFYDINLATDVTGTLGQAYIDAAIARDSELHDAVTLVGETYLTLADQQITAADINLSSQTTGTLQESKIDLAIARAADLHDAMTLDNSTYNYITTTDQALVVGPVDYATDIINRPTLNVHDSVTLAGESYLTLTNQAITAAAIDLTGSQVTGILPDAKIPSTIARDSELHDAVTLSGSYDYLTLTNQQIALSQIDYNTDIANLPSLAAHDAVTLAGETYLSLSGQEITAGKLDLSTSVTNTLAAANIDAAIARDTELHPALTTNGTGTHNYVTYTPATQYMEFFDVDLTADVIGILPDGNIPSTIARDTELHDAVTVSGAFDYVTLSGQDLVRGQIDLGTDVSGTLDVNYLPSANALDSELHDAVTLFGQSYLSLNGQEITAASIVLSGSQVTGTLPDAKIPSTIARDSELHDAVTLTGETFLTLTNQVITVGKVNLGGQVEGLLAASNIASTIARDTELHDEVTLFGQSYLSLNGQEITAASIVLSGSQVTGTLPLTKGGTGATSYTAAFDNLTPTTTKGDLIVDLGTGAVRFPLGSNGEVLTVNTANGTGLEWDTVNALPAGADKGDLIAYTGAAWVKVPKASSNGLVLKSDSAQTAGVAWATDNTASGGSSSFATTTITALNQFDNYGTASGSALDPYIYTADAQEWVVLNLNDSSFARIVGPGTSPGRGAQWAFEYAASASMGSVVVRYTNTGGGTTDKNGDPGYFDIFTRSLGGYWITDTNN